MLIIDSLLIFQRFSIRWQLKAPHPVWLITSGNDCQICERSVALIGPLQDSVTWYGINYAGTQVTQWDFQNKRTRTSPARHSFVLEVPLCNLRPSIIYSVPCDRIVQRAYKNQIAVVLVLSVFTDYTIRKANGMTSLASYMNQNSSYRSKFLSREKKFSSS